MQNCIHVLRTYKADVNYMDALKNVDALVCVGKFSSEEIARFRALTNSIIFLDMPVEDRNVSTITMDFADAMNTGLNYLTSLGHRRIGFLGGKEYLADGTLFPDVRRQLFCDYCLEHGLTFEAYIQEESFTTESGYRMMNRLLEQETLPTAVIASSDPIAIGALHALNDKGFRVPDDISLVGFDDTSLSAFTAPPLTTVHAPAYDMGNFGANIVFHILKQQPATAMKIQLPCRLVERQSCRKLQGTV